MTDPFLIGLYGVALGLTALAVLGMVWSLLTWHRWQTRLTHAHSWRGQFVMVILPLLLRPTMRVVCSSSTNSTSAKSRKCLAVTLWMCMVALYGRLRSCHITDYEFSGARREDVGEITRVASAATRG